MNRLVSLLAVSVLAASCGESPMSPSAQPELVNPVVVAGGVSPDPVVVPTLPPTPPTDRVGSFAKEDCEVSPWHVYRVYDWGICAAVDPPQRVFPLPIQSRRVAYERNIISPAENGGKACPRLAKSEIEIQFCIIDEPRP